MKQFPSEFSDVLTRKGKRLFASQVKPLPQFQSRSGQAPIVQLEGCLDQQFARNAIGLLDRHFGRLNDVHAADSGCRNIALASDLEPYSTKTLAPFSQRLFGLDLHPEDHRKAFAIAKRIALIDLIRSESLRELVSNVTGYPLRYGYGRPYCQLTRYGSGDYIGLHSDWQDAAHLSPGFLLLQLNLSNEGVRRQSLVYQQGEFLSGMLHYTRPSISLVRLPMWHMTTPLEARAGHERSARRWMVSVTFELASD